MSSLSSTPDARSTSVLRRMPPDEVLGLGSRAKQGLSQIYGRGDLVVFGLGVMIGAGIFNIAGRQAATIAGPGVILSFMIAGIASLLVALCYAELASAMPVSGSAYTFTYVVFGEMWAWIVGCALIVELELAAASVARAWSLYAAQTLADLGVQVPALGGKAVGPDLFTLAILTVLTFVVAFNARVGLRVLWVMVGAKLVAITAVIVVGARHVDAANLASIPADPLPLARDADVLHSTLFGLTFGQAHAFGWLGILAAAPAIVFAYVGFDLVATTAEETRDAPRVVPQGMIRSLAITTVIYIAVAAVMVGMVRYTEISLETPLGNAFRAVGEHFMVHVINIGAVLGLTTVILVLLVSQTRVVFAMARDGLLPRSLGRLTGRHQTPATASLISGAAAILLAELAPVLTMEQLVVMGTLFAFLFVAAGVIALRRRMPELPASFRTPLFPLVPVLAILATLWLMVNLQVITWIYFAVCMAGAVLLYLLYGRRASLLAPPPPGRGRHRR
ncbi:APC family permease [Sphaerimonospora cavernae]|uniref:APC family permease n=1 Tax=Sphaerimonospora cavernae TaxID=1740611 RepID=A0ABV6U8M9_9ACTN